VSTVSIVVPTCGRPQTLRRTLAALASLAYDPSLHEVIVVDDGNDPKTVGIIDEAGLAASVQLVTQNRLGAATARNAGARVARNELLLFVDDDMIVRPDHVDLHVQTHSSYPDSFVGGDRWYAPEALAALEGTPFGRYRIQLEREFQSRRHDRRLGDNCAEVVMLPANDLSMSRAAFWSLEGFDEEFPYAGAEDQDLCLKARQAGHRLIRNYAIHSEHDDPTVTLEQFSVREERGAETVVVLAQNFPEMLGRFADNGPIQRLDSVPLKLKKVAKAALSTEPVLSLLHVLAHVLERLPVSERRLQAVYRLVLGLHIFRGYRRALAARSTVASYHAAQTSP
jgi:GT2 family glycosyltransferase